MSKSSGTRRGASRRPIPPLRYRVYRGLWRLFWEAGALLIVMIALRMLAG